MSIAAQIFQPRVRFQPYPPNVDATAAQPAAQKTREQAAMLASAAAGAAHRATGGTGTELARPIVPASEDTLKVLKRALEAATGQAGAKSAHSSAETPKPVRGQGQVGLFGNSTVDDGFDVIIALQSALLAEGRAFQKMGADMAVTQLKVTQEQAQEIIKQGQDELEGAISGAVLQGAFCVGSAVQEFKGLKINETSLTEEMGRANANEELTLDAQKGLLGSRQAVNEEVREVELKPLQPLEEPLGESGMANGEIGQDREQAVERRNAAAERADQARSEEEAAERQMVGVEPSPSEPGWKHSQAIAGQTERHRVAQRAHQINHEFNYVEMRRCDARARLMSAVGEMAHRQASAAADLAKSEDRSEETIDGRFAELWGQVGNLHQDSARKVKTVQEDMLAVVRALVGQQSDLGSVVASKIV